MTLTDTNTATMAYWFLDTLAVVHRPAPPLVIEMTIPPGGSPPLHVHHGLDDSSYLLDGTLAVRFGEHTFRADPGTYLPQPAGVPHTFRVMGNRAARMLVVHADDSFLRLIQSLGIPARSRALPSDMPQVSHEELQRALRDAGVSTAEEAEAIALTPTASRAGRSVAVPDMAELHRRALEATGRIVANVAPGQWTAPTPCAAWDVHALVNHLVAGNLWAAELAGGRTVEEVGDRLDSDLLGTDPRCAYDASAAAANAAFAAPGALETPCAVSYGPVSGAVYASHRFLDVLIHGWDLAVATGQDTMLDPKAGGQGQDQHPSPPPIRVSPRTTGGAVHGMPAASDSATSITYPSLLTGYQLTKCQPSWPSPHRSARSAPSRYPALASREPCRTADLARWPQPGTMTQRAGHSRM